MNASTVKPPLGFNKQHFRKMSLKNSNWVIVLSMISVFACNEQITSIEGMWIQINENISPSQGRVFHFKEDSVVLWQHNFYKAKAAYKINGNKIWVSEQVDFHDNTAFGNPLEEFTIDFEIRNDTLVWGKDFISFKRSKYKSVVEHYANAKGLLINLPSSSQFNPSYLDYGTYLDFYLGFDDDGEIGILINNESAAHFQTQERIKLLQDTTTNRPIICRVFADKEIDMTHIHDIHTIMHRMNLKYIHYVTLDPTQLPYELEYRGIKIRKHRSNLIETDEEL